MEEKSKRKSIIYLVIGIVTLIALIAGATYAYFQAVTGNNAIANLNTTTGTTDNLTFSTDGNILINASADNFGENMGDQVSQANAMATLIPNNTTNKASDTYNVYLVINENTFEYTTEEENPELILSVKKDEEEYTGVKGLAIKDNITINKNGESPEQIKGYDITTKRGLIKISEGETITANGNQEKDKWEIRIILKNLDNNQNKNTGKTFNGKIIIQKEEIPTKILDVCQSGEQIANCLIKLHDESEYGITKLVYHDEQEDYKGETNYTLEADDSSYRYSGASEEVNNYICFGGECSNNPENENYSNLYRIIGVFPTTATKGLDEKTYQIKIIKADYATEEETGGKEIGAYYGKYISNEGNVISSYKGNSTYLNKISGYYWNKQQNESENDTNDWSKSNLQEKNLNDYYLNTYLNSKVDSEKWLGMIEEHNWTTAGNITANIREQNAKNAYNNEINNPVVGSILPTAAETVKARVGLMYVSDYMYGASKEHWTRLGYTDSNADYRGAGKDNWMYMGLFEWTITRRADTSFYALRVAPLGNTSGGIINLGLAVRPCLYLNSNVKIISGDGTPTNPYIISE